MLKQTRAVPENPTGTKASAALARSLLNTTQSLSFHLHWSFVLRPGREKMLASCDTKGHEH